METPIVTPWYMDKAIYAKLFLPVAVMACAWLNGKLPVPLSPETLSLLVGGLCASAVTYIAAHKWKTGTLQRAQIVASAVSSADPSDPAAGLAAVPK